MFIYNFEDLEKKQIDINLYISKISLKEQHSAWKIILWINDFVTKIKGRPIHEYITIVEMFLPIFKTMRKPEVENVTK